MTKKKSKKWVGITVAGLALLGIVTGSLTLKARAEPVEDIIWREYEVKKGTITASLDGGGTLKGSAIQYRPGSDVHIVEIPVKVGQAVKEGDILVRFSTDKLEKELEEKKAALASAGRSLENERNNRTKAELEREMAGREKQESKLKQYESQRKEKENAIGAQAVAKKQAIARLDGLKEELKRLEEQTSNTTVSGNGDMSLSIASVKNQISQAEADIGMADKNISSLVEELDTLEKEYGKQQEKDSGTEAEQDKIDKLTGANTDNAVKNAGAEVDLKRKQVEEAEKLLNQPFLVAEEDGVVTNILTEVDCDVAAGQAIIKIAQSEGRTIRVQIPQEDIGSVEEGQETEVQFLAFSDSVFKGTVSRKSLVPMEGTDSVVYEVEVALEQEEGMLEGMTAGVKFIRKRVEDVLTLSNKAITLRDGKQFVILKLPDGTHEEREITTGFSDGRVSEIKSGLQEGDIAVVEG